jgi:hypothetical protein
MGGRQFITAAITPRDNINAEPENEMFDARQYLNTSIAIRLSELSTAVEYSAAAEYNTHVAALRSGLFMVTTEAGAAREAEFGGRLVAIKGELV